MVINQQRTYLRFRFIQWLLRLLGFTIYHNPSTNVYIATKNSKWYKSRVDIILQDCKGLSDDELDEVIDRIHQIYSHYPMKGN